MTVFHSSHFPHLLKLSGQPYRRQKTLTIVRKPSPLSTFPGDFSGEVLFRHRPYHQVRKKEIFKFCQGIGGRFLVTRRQLAFLLRWPEPHAPAHEGTWSTFQQRDATSSFAWRHLATLHLCLCHMSPASVFFGVFVSVDPLNSLYSDLR